MQQEYAFYGDVLAILVNFSIRIAVFSILFSLYLSHNDGVPITDPRTLKQLEYSTTVVFVPSNTFMALSRLFYFTMS